MMEKDRFFCQFIQLPDYLLGEDVDEAVSVSLRSHQIIIIQNP